MFKSSFVELPNTAIFNDTHLCVPVGWWLTKNDLSYIAERVIKHAG
jgi:hypothetical protein